jgi:hypothetical protein
LQQIPDEFRGRFALRLKKFDHRFGQRDKNIGGFRKYMSRLLKNYPKNNRVCSFGKIVNMKNKMVGDWSGPGDNYDGNLF